MSSRSKEKAICKPNAAFALDFNRCHMTEEGNYAACFSCGRDLPIDLEHWCQSDIRSFNYRLGLQGPITFRGDLSKRTCRMCFPRTAVPDQCMNCFEELVADTPTRTGNLSRAQKTKHCLGQRKCKTCSAASGTSSSMSPCSNATCSAPEHAPPVSSSMIPTYPARDDIVRAQKHWSSFEDPCAKKSRSE